jgi:hypothetical protein
VNPFWFEHLVNWLYFVAWGFLIAAPLVWVIRHWWQTSPRIITPTWRSYLSIGATGLVVLSELSWFVVGFWIVVGGGGSYDPVFQRTAMLGFLAAPAGLLASLFGKGELRWPACSLSILMMCFWLVLGFSDL